MAMSLSPLPIDEVLPEVISTLRSHACLVLQAPTGAGKTTRLAPALLAAGLAGNQQIVLLEPRRLAARAAAARMAEETGTELGKEIGYQVRFERKACAATRILVMTDGVFLRMLQDDPMLEETSIVLFDEFHERSMNVDLALALVRRVQTEVRSDLRLVVMSATLAAKPVAEYLGDCPLVTSAGRMFPVDIEHLPHERTLAVSAAAAHGAEELLKRTAGDILVFLPGRKEIRETGRELEPIATRQALQIMELYGDLPLEKQRAVLDRSPQRKVVLATNVAETSVTVVGVTGVVDTGLANVMRHFPNSGMNSLQQEKISQASADQRAGRAGRTEPGVCLRLWTARDHAAREKQTTPELARVELSGAILQLLCWGETNLAEFPWFESPPEPALQAATSLLTLLGAMKEGAVTELGRKMVRLPLAPRVARMLWAGHEYGQPEAVALTAALLSERDPFRSQRTPRGPRQPNQWSDSDVVDRVTLLEAFAAGSGRSGQAGQLDAGAARFVLRASEQLLKLLRSEANSSTRSAKKVYSEEEAIRRALLAGLPDRVAKRREARSNRAVMVGGRGVRIADESSVTQAELFVCVELAETSGADALVRQASAVERAWLEEFKPVTEVQLEFDTQKEKVIALRRTRLVDLVLEEVSVALPGGTLVAERLAAEASARLDLKTLLTEEDQQLMARIHFLRTAMPELEYPVFAEVQFQELLPTLCSGCQSFADLRRAPWRHLLLGQLSAQQRLALERDAPQTLEVPSGSKIKLRYEPGRAPIVEVRIQELFGMQATPRVAAGRVALLFHLLGPNYRPQQITDDLASFWANTYPQVRKDLRRRYPKHSWPEDPLQAKAEYRPGRKRK